MNAAPHTIVLLNTKSRDGQAAQHQRDIETAFAEYRYPVTVRAVGEGTGVEIGAAVKMALGEGYRTIVAAGGDGTIRSVAAVVAQTPDAILGILPLGTFNHFAKDAGIPTDLAAAVGIIAAGHTRQVDCATVNGWLFLNSAALGLHPLFVRQRQFYQCWFGKWLATPVALVQAFWRYRCWSLTLELNGQRITRQTPLVFIGNNDYQVERLGLPKREDLSGGRLYLYVLDCASRWQFLHLARRILLGQTNNQHYFQAFAADSCRLEVNQTVQLTIDGELIRLQSPLEFMALPGRITILAPDA